MLAHGFCCILGVTEPAAQVILPSYLRSVTEPMSRVILPITVEWFCSFSGRHRAPGEGEHAPYALLGLLDHVSDARAGAVAP